MSNYHPRVTKYVTLPVFILAAGVAIAGCGASSSNEISLMPSHQADSRVAASTTPPNAALSAPAATPQRARTLVLPAHVQNLTALTGSTAADFATNERQAMTKARPAYAELYAHALLGVYSTGAADISPLMLYIGMDMASSPLAAGFRSQDPASYADAQLLDSGVTDGAAFDPGPLGGALRCGSMSAANSGSVVCVWADASTCGVVMAMTQTTAAKTASFTLVLRNESEH